MAGLNICLVIQTQDRSADYLFNCKIETSPVVCNDNLSAVRSETTKMLLESLNKLKHADARLKMNQGVLEGVGGWRRSRYTSRIRFYFFSICTRKACRILKKCNQRER